MLLGVLVTAAGFIGLFITIVSLYYEIIPSKKKKITKQNMTLIIIWLALFFLGFTNLYYIRNENQGSISSGSTDNHGEDDSNTMTDKEDPFLQEKLFIEENYDYIQQIKSSYSEADTKIIEDDTVDFRIVEKAGYIYQDLMKTGKPEILAGSFVNSAQIIILDYLSDDIIYTYTSQNGIIHHLPGNQNKFYCVVMHEDYDICVTQPIQVIEKEHEKYYNGIDIYLDKKNSNYTPLSRICLYMRDLKSNDESPSVITDDYIIRFTCINTNSKSNSSSFQINTLNSGILSYSEKSFFCLNTNYIMQISLYHKSDDNHVLAQQTFDGSIIDSNLTEIIFEVDDK